MPNDSPILGDSGFSLDLPSPTRRLRALQATADRSDRGRQRAPYFTLLRPEASCGRSTSQILRMVRRSRHPVAVAPLRGALDDSRLTINQPLVSWLGPQG